MSKAKKTTKKTMSKATNIPTKKDLKTNVEIQSIFLNKKEIKLAEKRVSALSAEIDRIFDEVENCKIETDTKIAQIRDRAEKLKCEAIFDFHCNIKKR